MNHSDIRQHISEQFNKELEQIHTKVLIMGGLVERQIEQAVQAFTTSDGELAERVIKQDNEVDKLEMAIDLACMQILARRQPAAFDLRLLITVIKVIHELEKIGDKAERVAKIAIKLDGNPDKLPHHEVEHLATLVTGMLHDALDAFARMTVDAVPAIIERDETIDLEYDNILRQLNTRMMEDPRNITRTLEVLWTVRALERIGDHACYICEHLVYMIKSQDVRHLKRSALEKKVNGLE
jgi:phosphate transport system protein